jgi:hypothetical protein
VNTELGANYQVKFRADDTRTERFHYRLAENSFGKINRRLALEQRFEHLPQFDQPGEFRLRLASNLRCWLLNNLYLTVSDQYDSRSAGGVTKNARQIRSARGVKF